MTKITDINEAESIRTGRLIFKRGFQYYFDKAFAFFFSVVMFGAGILLELTAKVDGELSGFFAYVIYPVLIIAGLYCLYRLVTEYKLMIVNTGYSKIQNHKLLKLFLNKFQYHPYHENGDIIIAEDTDEMSGDSGFENKKEYIFIIDDRIIYFNAVKINRGTTFPSLFSHLFLKHDLKKFIFKESKL